VIKLKCPGNVNFVCSRKYLLHNRNRSLNLYDTARTQTSLNSQVLTRL